MLPVRIPTMVSGIAAIFPLPAPRTTSRSSSTSASSAYSPVSVGGVLGRGGLSCGRSPGDSHRSCQQTFGAPYRYQAEHPGRPIVAHPVAFAATLMVLGAPHVAVGLALGETDRPRLALRLRRISTIAG